MNKRNSIKNRITLATLALTAVTAIGMPRTADAAYVGTMADAKIVNVVRVDYTDISGNNSFAATASTTITVNLVKSSLATYAPPTAGTGVPAGLSCPSSTQTYTSGSTVSFLYALAAKANGDDIYTLTKSIPATSNVSPVTVNMELLNYAGGSPTAIAVGPGGTASTFGSATPVGVSGTDTLLFPGGALAGFAANDIVLVNLTTGGIKAFLVDTVTVGSAKTHDNPGNADHTDVGNTGNETQGSLKLKAYPDQSIVLNGTTFTFGGNVTPAFNTNGPITGEPVGELKLVHVTVQASATGTADGTVTYRLDTTDGTNTSNLECTAGNFKGVSLQIRKAVKNITLGDASYAATTVANPGNILEYQVTVDATSGVASQVVVTDTVPAYTTLTTFTTGNYGIAVPDGTAAANNVFAQISDGVNTVNVTVDGTDSEAQPGGATETGFGKAVDLVPGTATVIESGSGLTFYVGDTSTNGAGGSVNAATNYTIIYRIKVD